MQNDGTYLLNILESANIIVGNSKNPFYYITLQKNLFNEKEFIKLSNEAMILRDKK